jgi:hypothetical protein
VANANVCSYSFSHRLSQSVAGHGAYYVDINHNCQTEHVRGLVEQFFYFAQSCGYCGSSILEAFDSVSEEHSPLFRASSLVP